MGRNRTKSSSNSDSSARITQTGMCDSLSRCKLQNTVMAVYWHTACRSMSESYACCARAHLLQRHPLVLQACCPVRGCTVSPLVSPVNRLLPVVPGSSCTRPPDQPVRAWGTLICRARHPQHPMQDILEPRPRVERAAAGAPKISQLEPDQPGAVHTRQCAVACMQCVRCCVGEQPGKCASAVWH